MKKIIFLILITLFSTQLHAQLLGRHYDPGSFYTNDGKKISGLISFNNFSDYFFYKESDKADNTKYKAEAVKALVVIAPVKQAAVLGWNKRPKNPETVIDSFVVRAIEKPNKNLYFAKVICDFSAYKIYHKILAPRGGAPTVNNMYTADPNANMPASMQWSQGRSYPGGYETYYEKDGVTYELTKNNYKAILAEAFADVPATVAMLNDTKFKAIEKVIQAYINAKTGVDLAKK